MNEAELLAEEIESWNNPCARAAAKLRRLVAINAELVVALEKISSFSMSQFSNAHDLASECIETAYEALEKAKQ